MYEIIDDKGVIYSSPSYEEISELWIRLRYGKEYGIEPELGTEFEGDVRFIKILDIHK